MLTPEVKAVLASRPEIDTIILFGIEAHVCILQTALSLLDPPSARPYTVYIPADGISSCNKTEVPIAIARLREAGAIITTSESIAFQLVQDSARPEFKAFSTLIKSSKDVTKAAGDVLLSHL